MSWVLAFLSAFFFLISIHPFLIYPATLRLIRSSRDEDSEQSAGEKPMSFALCVCAYNEEAVIDRKIDNMMELQRRGNVEVLVYVDAATDRTAALLERAHGRFSVHVSPERNGKTYGMNFLVARATASIVVFTDANVMIDPDALDAIERRFRDPRIGCVCGHLIYVNAAGTATSEVGSIYWRLEEAIKEGESRIGAAMGADGSLFAIRRSLHRPVPINLIDDMYLSLEILCDGYRVVRAADALAFEESVTAPREEFRRKIRIACQAFNVHRTLWPRLRRLPLSLRYMYLSHKLLRWMSIYNLAIATALGVGAAAAAGMPAYAILLLAVSAMAFLWLLRRRSPIAEVIEILAALAGAGIGVLHSLRGRRFQTWTPATSIRQADRPCNRS